MLLQKKVRRLLSFVKAGFRVLIETSSYYYGRFWSDLSNPTVRVSCYQNKGALRSCFCRDELDSGRISPTNTKGWVITQQGLGCCYCKKKSASPCCFLSRRAVDTIASGRISPAQQFGFCIRLLQPNIPKVRVLYNPTDCVVGLFRLSFTPQNAQQTVAQRGTRALLRKKTTTNVSATKVTSGYRVNYNNKNPREKTHREPKLNVPVLTAHKIGHATSRTDKARKRAIPRRR